MSGTDELDKAKNGVVNESSLSPSSTTSDLNGHSEPKRTATAPADHSGSVVATTTSTSPSNWVQFGNGADNSDNVSASAINFIYSPRDIWSEQ